jgi:hypothetical protein
VTSYMECSAREYSRTSIISNSDISPLNTEELLGPLRYQKLGVSASNGRNSLTPAFASQTRDETKPSFDPQFLQNKASAGLAVLQFFTDLRPLHGFGPRSGVWPWKNRILE